ncbi:MAG: hypothetical protein JWN93_313 [Hyphomicrobiales bacterium]|nr:hypothetical protein [Hyphomicrobiales bacterium]
MQNHTPDGPLERPQARRWLVTFFCALAAPVVLTGAVLWWERDRLPAPQLTPNLSFNEKMRWARGPLREGRCGTLVLGSSMALNNLDGDVLARKGYAPVLNLGAWGLGVVANRRLLDLVLEACRPKRIIMPVYYGDFGPLGANDFDAGKLRAYLGDRGASDLSFYLRGATLVDLRRDYRNLARYRRRGADDYTNLNFDGTGAALLACEGFQRDAGRWNGFASMPVAPSAQAMQALAQIAAVASRAGIPLTVMETPLRGAAREALGEGLAAWRAQVSDIAQAGGARFVPAPADLADESFADYAHLNACGAKAWAQAALPALEAR